MTYSIRLTEGSDESARNAIATALVSYNADRTGRQDVRPLILRIDDENGQVVGGLVGHTSFDWLFVALLFVPESLRGRGVGTELMQRAEAEALARGCHNAWLDTFEFQARGFYERLGYTCFSELRDYPPGYARYFMRKALLRATPGSAVGSPWRY